MLTGIFGNGKNSVKVNVTPSPASIAATGKTLKNAVANAKSVANALNVVSNQLADASANLKKNAVAVANVAADAVKANAPAAAEALRPVVGPSNAALLNHMPKSVIVGGARSAIEEAAKQIKALSGAARDAANAVNAGVKSVGKVANYVAMNVNKVNPNSVNDAVNGAEKAVNANVGELVGTKLNLNSNVNKNTLNSVAVAAKDVANAANNKMMNNSNNNIQRNGGSRKASRKVDRKDVKKLRKNKKNGGASRKNKKVVNNLKNGGFLSMF